MKFPISWMAFRLSGHNILYTYTRHNTLPNPCLRNKKHSWICFFFYMTIFLFPPVGAWFELFSWSPLRCSFFRTMIYRGCPNHVTGGNWFIDLYEWNPINIYQPLFIKCFSRVFRHDPHDNLRETNSQSTWNTGIRRWVWILLGFGLLLGANC